MDNVPVKISEQFKPPRKITLPVGYQHRLPVPSLAEEYDFKLEQSVLNKMGEWRKLRKNAAEARKQRIKAHEAANRSKLCTQVEQLKLTDKPAKNVCDPCNTVYSHPTVSPFPTQTIAYSNSNTSPPYQTPNNILPTTNHQQYSLPNSILTPIPISQQSVDNHIPKVLSQFNISDFEADTSSPFDNMELKTINDMEELAHVLQPISNSPNHKGLSHYTPTTNYVNSHRNTLDHSKQNKDLNITPHLNGMTAYSIMYSSIPRSRCDESTEDYSGIGIGTSPRTYEYVPPENLPQHGNYYMGQSWHTLPTSNPQQTYEKLDYSHCPATEKLDYSHCPPTGNAANSTDDEQHSSSTAGLSLSKSVPDIIQELERELTDKRAAENSNRTPPRPNSFGSAGLEDWKPWPNLDSPENPSIGARKMLRSLSSSLPNPFQKLSPTSQRLARHISEMGFALPRVARACIALGEDDKKIVEFLLQVQALEERNFPADLAERALVINSNNMSEALTFLEMTKQMLDLGFSEDRVIEALVKFKNDRDKALDFLIS